MKFALNLKLALLLITLLLNDEPFAQGNYSTANSKLSFDSLDIMKWPRLGPSHEAAISDDGRYFAYTMSSYESPYKLLHIKSLDDRWERKLTTSNGGRFLSLNRFCVQLGDTLKLIELGKMTGDKNVLISSYKLSSEIKPLWIAYILKETGSLITENLLSRQKIEITKTPQSFQFSKSGRTLMYVTDTVINQIKQQKLCKFIFQTLQTELIKITVGNQRIINYISNVSGDKIALYIENELVLNNEQKDPFIWLYDSKKSDGETIATNHAAGIPCGFEMKGGISFSASEEQILFEIEQSKVAERHNNNINLDVWNYKDTILQSTQLLKKSRASYQASISLTNRLITVLTNKFESIKLLGENFAIVSKNSMGARFWLNQKDSNFLVSLIDGNKQLVATNGNCQFWETQSCPYILFFDEIEGGYFSINKLTFNKQYISKGVPKTDLLHSVGWDSNLISYNAAVGVAGWLPWINAVWVYTNFDIWQLDLAGRQSPINITNNYGRQNRIKLRISLSWDERVFKKRENILLTGFNIKTKENGFFTLRIGQYGKLVCKTMGAYAYDLTEGTLFARQPNHFDFGIKPIKAAEKEIWVVKRQSFDDHPNYYWTKDFESYQPLTNIQPQKEFSWLKTELITYQLDDGTYSQGILYKPENFDSTIKYPVLFQYYDHFSHRMYQYPAIDFSYTTFNIPYLVNRGYLVFTPDLYVGQDQYPMHKRLSCVLGARNYLCKLPFVDSAKIGLNGHSKAGGITNYIITHTDKFAAALEGAGVSDIVSSALTLTTTAGYEESRLGWTEQNSAFIWENTERWPKESPILLAHKVKTPLLIFHSKSDDAVPWAQAVEMFLALQRLEKPVWILQYDDGNHGVGRKDAYDYTKRITQFFDHYLKGALPPRWMTVGIPARLKNIDDGLDLDRSGRLP